MTKAFAGTALILLEALENDRLGSTKAYDEVLGQTCSYSCSMIGKLAVPAPSSRPWAPILVCDALGTSSATTLCSHAGRPLLPPAQRVKYVQTHPYQTYQANK